MSGGKFVYHGTGGWNAGDWKVYDALNRPKPYLRLRQLGNGSWAIVRVQPYQQFGSEVVATDLTRADAERLINMAKEK